MSSRPPEAPPGGYTLCKDPAAEARVTQDLSRVGAGLFSEVGHSMRSLVLCGSFARGEGVVTLRENEPHAEPGYQLIALFERRAGRHLPLLAQASQAWTHLLRCWVQVVPFDLSDIARVPATMFWFHVGRGQRITLIGDPTAVRAVPERSSLELPPAEALRLQTEATVALALANLDREADASLRAELLDRLVLAIGDAALLLRGAYHESLSERAASVRRLEPADGLDALYDAAVARRSGLRVPGTTPGGRLLTDRAQRIAQIHLALEHARIGAPRDPASYAHHRTRTDQTAVGALHSLRMRLSGNRHAERARERLLRAAVALAHDHRNDAARAAAARALGLGRSSAGPNDAELAAALRIRARACLDDATGHPFARWRSEPRRLDERLLGVRRNALTG